MAVQKGAKFTAEELLQQLKPLLNEKIIGHVIYLDELTLHIAPANIFTVLETLKNHKSWQFTYLIDLTAVDYLTYPQKPEFRFGVTYELFSPASFNYLRIKAFVGAYDVPSTGPLQPHVPSVVGLWRGADWLERETYDMFGIFFDGHPNLQRILMTEEHQGYPLRKEYPLHGPPAWPLLEKRGRRKLGLPS